MSFSLNREEGTFGDNVLLVILRAALEEHEMAQTKPAGSWTYEDLLSLPDDGRRYEIIEGELYEMALRMRLSLRL